MNTLALTPRLATLGRLASTAVLVSAGSAGFTVPSAGQTPITVPISLPAPVGLDFGATLHMQGARFITGTGPIQIFQVPASGSAVLMPALPFPPPPPQVAYSGFTVAINGDLAVLADPSDGEGIVPASAHIYEYDGTSWNYVQNTGAYPDVFLYGRSAAFHGDQLLIGESLGGPGRVYVYDRTGGTWAPSATQPWFEPHNGWHNGNNGSQFGHAMAVSGDRLIVTQPFNPLNGANLYHWDGSQWVFEVELGFNGPGDDSGSIAGTEVDFDGDIIVFGSPFDLGGGHAYVFEHDGMQWVGPTTLAAPDAEPGAHFGAAVAVNAATGRIAIGSPTWDDPDVQRVGAAYVFHRVALGNWQVAERLQPALYVLSREFGQVVQMNDEVVVLGTRALGYSVHTMTVPNGFAAPFAPSLCHGDGGDQAGCVDCPCGNNAPMGTRGGCLNASGSGAELRAERSLSVTDDSLRFLLEGTSPAAFALLTSGATVPVTTGCGPGSGRSATTITDGLRCVGGGMRRHGIRLSNGDGDVTTAWDGLVAGFGFTAGEVRVFQAVYRDGPTATPCGTGLNSSNAVEITWLP